MMMFSVNGVTQRKTNSKEQFRDTQTVNGSL